MSQEETQTGKELVEGEQVGDRFQVRDASGPGWDWLPDWCVVDTAEQVRVAAYDDEGEARRDCADRNAEATR